MISIDTKVTVGFAIVLLGIAFAWGKLDTQVMNVSRQVDTLSAEFHGYVLTNRSTAVRR